MRTTVSTPGKVLITGGYLVLDPNCSGLVLATSARFYVTIEDSDDKQIKVNSRQLDWQGIYEMHSDKLECVKGSENKFVETAIFWALKYIGVTNVSLHIEIRTDNDFYSQYDTLKEMNLPICSESLTKVPKFNKLLKFHKTGLGSSAALVTSLISGLMIHFNRKSYDLNIIHNMAQFCHNLAQGKIGSGFDVSSCVYGSQKFTRSIKEIRFDNLTEEFHKHESFELPKPWRLFLGEIHQGSNTPSLVSAVLRWKKDKPKESQDLWDKLNHLNLKFEHLMKIFDQDKIRSTFYEIRKCLKQMGQESGAEIEPDSQTNLVDKTMDIKGVLIAGVPGAGGFDAIFAIVDGEETKQRVEDLWVQMNVVPLLLRESHEGIKIIE